MQDSSPQDSQQDGLRREGFSGRLEDRGLANHPPETDTSQQELINESQLEVRQATMSREGGQEHQEAQAWLRQERGQETR